MSAVADYLWIWDHLVQGAPSLPRLILEYGYQAPRVIACPKCYRGAPRVCYNNAVNTVLYEPRRFAYVEGYATSVIPVAHAWVWDRKEDAIFDPTWWRGKQAQPDPAEYWGVVFRTPYLRRYVCREKRAALLMADPGHALKLATDPKARERALVLKGEQTV